MHDLAPDKGGLCSTRAYDECSLWSQGRKSYVMPGQTERQQLLLPDCSLEKEHLKVKDAIETECICHKSFISLKSVNGEIRLVDRLWNSEKLQENFENEDHVSNDENDEEHALNLSSLLSTLQKCSTRNLSQHQVSGIIRLAKCCKASDTITKDQAQILQMLLKNDGSSGQVACLIVLSKLAAVPDNLEFIFKHFSAVIDCIFNIASDPKSNEIQLAALEVIEQISKHQELTTVWDKQLEDIVYPLALSLIKSDSSTIDIGQEPAVSDRYRADQLMSRANKKLRCSDCQLWTYLDDFIGHLAVSIEKYGCLEKQEDFSNFKCELSKFGNINNDQLTVIAALIGCFNNFCFWPVHHPKCHEDFIFISDDNIINEELRQQLKCLKHHHVFLIWEKVGKQIMTLCRHFASRLNLFNKKSKDRSTEEKTCSPEIKNPCDAPQSTQEIKVMELFLNFLLYMAATSCYTLPSEQPLKNISEKPIENGIKKKLHEKLAEREILTEKRLLRRQLIEEGLFSVMGQLIQLDNINIKIISTTIIRLCLQPTGEKYVNASTKPRYRAMSADVHKPLMRLSDHQVNDRAGPILGTKDKHRTKQRPHSSLPSMMHSKGNTLSDEVLKREATFLFAFDSRKYSLFTPLTPRTQKKPIHQKTYFTERESRVFTENTNHFTPDINVQNYGADHLAYLMSPLEAGCDIVPQCCERILRSSAADVLKGIFSLDSELKKISLFLLHDLVKNGQTSLHMEMSKLGCVPKLINFIRINDNDLLLEITGLTITRLMLASDRRICQLFNFHGGSHLLMALLQNKPPEDLKEAIVSTLNTVNYMVHTDQSNGSSNGPADIWGHTHPSKFIINEEEKKKRHIGCYYFSVELPDDVLC
ncbi:hypothetical protein Btru_001117 [Bulinus truncatus]|nr:hypothetical protein Btru_001117 [Bulinus truncatus]